MRGFNAVEYTELIAEATEKSHPNLHRFFLAFGLDEPPAVQCALCVGGVCGFRLLQVAAERLGETIPDPNTEVLRHVSSIGGTYRRQLDRLLLENPLFVRGIHTIAKSIEVKSKTAINMLIGCTMAYVWLESQIEAQELEKQWS